MPENTKKNGRNNLIDIIIDQKDKVSEIAKTTSTLRFRIFLSNCCFSVDVLSTAFHS